MPARRAREAILNVVRPHRWDRVRAHGLSAGAGFWVVTCVLTVAFALTTLPTPLYSIYQERNELSTLLVTVAFAAYPLGNLLTLFLAGPLSDWFGRRAMLLPALAAGVVAALIFLAWPDLPGLIVARAMCGVAIGIAAPTAIAHMTELDAIARPGATSPRSEVVSTVANFGGLGIGALVAGLLAAFGPDPLHTPFLVFAVLLLLSAIAIAAVPETVHRGAARPRYRPQRVSVPPAARSRYFATLAAGMTAFAVTGLFTSVAPRFLAETVREDSLALAGAVSFLILSAGAVAPILSARMAPGRQVATGQCLMSLGLVLLIGVVWVPSLALFLVGGTLAGAGAGGLVRGCVSSVIEIAPAESRGEALAGYFLAGYLALAVPVMALGLVADLANMRVAVVGLASCALAITGLVGPLLMRQTGRSISSA